MSEKFFYIVISVSDKVYKPLHI